MAAALELDDVGVRFGSFDAVDGVSLSVHAGEIVGLIGPNGAGKTVTFNTITGLQKPTRGRVRIDGQDVTALPAHERARLGIARTFQVLQIFAGMSVLDNVMVAAHRFTRGGVVADAFALPSKRRALNEARERSMAVLDFLHMTDVYDIDAASLPIGQARLVELARALVLKPRVLLLDEPASGLDSSETSEFIELLARIRTVLGTAMLLVEHDMGVVMPLCDHIAVMDFGRVVSAGSPERVRSDASVLEAYLGAGAVSQL